MQTNRTTVTPGNVRERVIGSALVYRATTREMGL